VLNRLFIIVGLIAILALAAAFIVPGYIQWGDYRGRMEEIASETFGAPVEITGDIEFSLLPQPQFNFAKVVVGTAEKPVMTIEQAEAQFSLIDFIRDKYTITSLVLDQPVLDVRIGADGAIESGIVLAEQVSTSNVSVANAQIVDGTVRVADARSGETFAAGNVDGELRIEALRGPFTFQGSAEYGGDAYGVRFVTTTLDAEGGTQLTAFARPVDERFSINVEGQLKTGASPGFIGNLIYRQAPPKATADQPVDAGKGDLVITSKIEATAEKVLLPEYTVIPDENRTGTRLAGAAEVQLGKSPSFNAVISGASMALPPRDATTEGAVVPYELVRLLGELPLPPELGVPGTIGVDIAELNLRAVTLRDVRLDAVAQAGGGWQVKTFSAQLPGATSLKLSGDLQVAAGKPNFSGHITIATRRLDALATLWRKAPEGNPLFNMPGGLAADVALVGETLSLSNGVLSLDEVAHPFAAEIGFGPTSRHLNLTAHLAQLSAEDSAAFAALLPEMNDGGAFALTFPAGKFDVSAPGAILYGLEGVGLVAQGSWEGGVIVADRLAASDLGGAAFDAKVTAFGSFAKPEVSGAATLQVGMANAPALDRIFDLLNTPTAMRDLLRRSVPADLALRLDPPSGEGGQGLAVAGRVASADLAFDAKLGEGFLRALAGPLSFQLDLKSGDSAAMTAQLGLGDLSLTPEGEAMHAVAVVEGTPSNSLETTLLVEGGGDSVAFAGNIVVSDPEELSGNGTVKVTLTDFAALTEGLGAGGIDVPAVSGSAHVEFVGTTSLALDDIDATSGGQPVSGSLSLSQTGETRSVDGALTIGSFDPQGLISVLVGRQAMLPGAGTWPEGPFAMGYDARTTTGRVTVAAPAITVGGKPVVTDAKFELNWDATNTRIRNFAGTVGGGQINLDMGVCCANALPDKQVNGRLTLTGVALDAIVPPLVADALEGKVDVAAAFDGTGGDLQSTLNAMTGQGTYTINDFRIERMDPGAFAAAAALENVLEEDALVLQAAVVDKLDDAPFEAKPLSGSFTIAGGVIRSPNLGIESDLARLFGSTSVSLKDLSVGGGFVMSPTSVTDPNGLVTEATAQIAANLGGTLPAPDRTFDVTGMIDGMKAKALEIEVARLERLQAEDQARQKAAAEERARIAAEEAKKKALEEAAKKAAEDAAAKKAAEEAAKKKAAEDAAAKRAAEEAERQRLEQQQEQQQSTDIVGPLDLGI
jgi:hypothetical protein